MIKRYFILVLIALAMSMVPGQCQDIKLIIRGDDFGMTQGSLVAFERAFNEGVLQCGAMVVPGPWSEAASELARKNPGWCVGIHLCLFGEWRGYRWRPVLPYDKVPSIVDEDGFLYQSPNQLFAHKPKLEEIDAELRAQVLLAKKRGVNIAYVDTHYIGLNSYPGIDQVIKKLASDFGVPISGEVGERHMRTVYTTPIDQKLKSAVQNLEALTPGLWLWVSHIGIDSPEQRALIHWEPKDIFVDAGVGRHRAEELNVLTSLEVKSEILRKGIVLTNYREVWKERR